MIRSIAHLIKANIVEQTYADVVAGIVVAHTKQVNSDPPRYLTYALACDVDGRSCSDDDLVALFPDDSKRSIIFFEDRTGLRPVGFEDQFLKMQCTLRVVGWVNPLQMGRDPDCAGCSTATQIALNILSLLPPRNHNITSCKINALNVQWAGFAPDGENVFARYNAVVAERRPFTARPYEMFAVDLLCTWRMHPSCFEAPEIGEPLCPSSPVTPPDPEEQALCPSVRVCRTDIQVGEVPMWDGEKWIHDTPTGGGGGEITWTEDEDYVYGEGALGPFKIPKIIE